MDLGGGGGGRVHEHMLVFVQTNLEVIFVKITTHGRIQSAEDEAKDLVPTKHREEACDLRQVSEALCSDKAYSASLLR